MRKRINNNAQSKAERIGECMKIHAAVHIPRVYGIGEKRMFDAFLNGDADSTANFIHNKIQTILLEN